MSATPACFPRARIPPRTRCRWMVEEGSAWTTMESAPLSAKAPMKFSGSTISRLRFRCFDVAFRMAATTPGPKVMLGTKRPSMMSTCSQSAPAWATVRHSSASRPKSAESTEGAIRISSISAVAHTDSPGGSRNVSMALANPSSS